MKKILQLFALFLVAVCFGQTTPVITAISASNIGNNAATINYTVNAFGQNVSRQLFYSFASQPVSSTTAISFTNNAPTAYTTNLNGLTQNRRYTCNIAVPVDGNSVFPGTGSVTFTTTGSLTVPTVSAVSIGSITQNSAVLSYNFNPNGNFSISTAGIIYTNMANGSSTSVLGAFDVSGTSTVSYSKSLTGLQANTLYSYEIYGYNSSADSQPITGTFTTSAAPAIPAPLYHFQFNNSLVATDGTSTFALQVGGGTLYTLNSTSLDFPGSGSANFSANLPNLPIGASPRTVSIKIKFAFGGLGAENNVFSWGTAANGQAYGWNQSDGANARNIFWGSTDLIFYPNLNHEIWYNMTFVYDGTNVRIYKDGVLINLLSGGNQVTSVARTLSTTGTTLWLGSVLGATAASNRLHANIDDLQIYNTALTAAQVAALHTTLSNEEFNANNIKFFLYPNPATDILNIEMEAAIEIVEIYSLQGQKLIVASSKEINVSSLSSGIYVVKVQDVDGVIATQKLVIK